jgi:hypothetical protein
VCLALLLVSSQGPLLALRALRGAARALLDHGKQVGSSTAVSRQKAELGWGSVHSSCQQLQREHVQRATGSSCAEKNAQLSVLGCLPRLLALLPTVASIGVLAQSANGNAT